MVSGKLHIGTSGWHYRHWLESFYPEGMASRNFLAFYAERFSTVEINNTFYRLPSRETLTDWRETTPHGFVFACKASRYITHMKKLKDPRESTKEFFEAVDVLGDRLGPILFQLPPRWRANSKRLAAFLNAMPEGYRFAFEFRDRTWYSEEVLDLLARRNAAFCIYDLDRHHSPERLTANFVYMRLHGPDGAYRGKYSERALRTWAEKLQAWRAQGLDVYCYFDNDEQAYAATNASRLLDLVRSN